MKVLNDGAVAQLLNSVNQHSSNSEGRRHNPTRVSAVNPILQKKRRKKEIEKRKKKEEEKEKLI